MRVEGWKGLTFSRLYALPKVASLYSVVGKKRDWEKTTNVCNIVHPSPSLLDESFGLEKTLIGFDRKGIAELIAMGDGSEIPLGARPSLLAAFHILSERSRGLESFRFPKRL